MPSHTTLPAKEGVADGVSWCVCSFLFSAIRSVGSVPLLPSPPFSCRPSSLSPSPSPSLLLLVLGAQYLDSKTAPALDKLPLPYLAQPCLIS